MKGTLAVTGIPEADQLVNTEPLAVLLGMLLDQQVQQRTATGGLAAGECAHVHIAR